MGLDRAIFLRNCPIGWRETAKIGAFCGLNGVFFNGLLHSCPLKSVPRGTFF